jgi:hypothetical protein
MKLAALTAFLVLATSALAAAGPASGTVKTATGTIAPRQAAGYVVRDSRHARSTRVELLLTDVSIDTTPLKGDLDPHATAINLRELRDRNYLLLWVWPDGTVAMNATYSATMTQYINDTAGGLKAELTTHTASKIEGRIYSPSPLKTMDGPGYTIDVTFSADVIPALAGAALPAGGGDPGKALTAFLSAVTKKNWPAIKAGLSPAALPSFDRDYNSPKENAESAADIIGAWLPLTKAKVAGGILVNEMTAVVELEGERFGSRQLSLVKMVKTGAVWQFDRSAPAGSVPKG